jgi:hypothetical protein
MAKHIFKENHYRPFIKGKLCKKWSGRLPVNYGNEKSNPKGVATNIYSTDTTKGCSMGCVGCYGARLCAIAHKNFGWIKSVTLTGKPKGNPFIWTTACNPIPDQLLRSDIGFNITVDTMRSKSVINKALRAIKSLSPDRVIVCYRVYPGNKTSANRCLKLAKSLRAIGYKNKIQLPIRLFSKKLADQTGSLRCPKGMAQRLAWYKSIKVKGLGPICGSLGSGKCIDCMICYNFHDAKYRIGTSADPADRWQHTVNELVRLNWIPQSPVG